jgi:hypothetical protein
VKSEQTRGATIDSQTGVYWRVQDWTGEVHYLLDSHFDLGAPREIGARVWIEYRSGSEWPGSFRSSRRGAWHVCAGNRP